MRRHQELLTIAVVGSLSFGFGRLSGVSETMETAYSPGMDENEKDPGSAFSRSIYGLQDPALIRAPSDLPDTNDAIREWAAGAAPEGYVFRWIVTIEGSAWAACERIR